MNDQDKRMEAESKFCPECGASGPGHLKDCTFDRRPTPVLDELCAASELGCLVGSGAAWGGLAKNKGKGFSGSSLRPGEADLYPEEFRGTVGDSHDHAFGMTFQQCSCAGYRVPGEHEMLVRDPTCTDACIGHVQEEMPLAAEGVPFHGTLHPDCLLPGPGQTREDVVRSLFEQAIHNRIQARYHGLKWAMSERIWKLEDELRKTQRSLEATWSDSCDTPDDVAAPTTRIKKPDIDMDAANGGVKVVGEDPDVPTEKVFPPLPEPTGQGEHWPAGKGKARHLDGKLTDALTAGVFCSCPVCAVDHNPTPLPPEVQVPAPTPPPNEQVSKGGEVRPKVQGEALMRPTKKIQREARLVVMAERHHREQLTTILYGAFSGSVELRKSPPRLHNAVRVVDWILKELRKPKEDV